MPMYRAIVLKKLEKRILGYPTEIIINRNSMKIMKYEDDYFPLIYIYYMITHAKQ